MNAFWEKKKNLLTDGARNSRPIRPAHISFSKTSLHSVQTGRGIRTVARQPRGARSWSWGPALRGGRLADTLTAGQSSCSLRGSEWRGSLLLGFHMAQKAFSRETQSSPSELYVRHPGQRRAGSPFGSPGVFSPLPFAFLFLKACLKPHLHEGTFLYNPKCLELGAQSSIQPYPLSLSCIITLKNP